MNFLYILESLLKKTNLCVLCVHACVHVYWVCVTEKDRQRWGERGQRAQVYGWRLEDKFQEPVLLSTMGSRLELRS